MLTVRKAMAAMAVWGMGGVASAAVQGPAYTAVGLSAPSGELFLTGISNSGQISGYSERYSSSQGWTHQVVRIVDGVGYHSILGKGHGINDSDVIVGEGRVGTVYRAMYEPFLGGNYLVNDVNMFYGRAIGNDGTIAGESYEGSWGSAVLTWKPGQSQARNFGRPAGSEKVDVVGINSRGTVIGHAHKDDTGGSPGWSRPYFIDTVGQGFPTFKFLPALGNDPEAYVTVSDINAGGLIVGTSGGQPVVWRTRAGNGPSYNVVEARYLGTLARELPFHVGAALGVDNNNRVVGWAYSDEGKHGFLYANGRMTDLNDLFSGQVDGFDITIAEAVGINDKGQIIAYGSFSDWGGTYKVPLLLNPNYGSAQVVALPPSQREVVDGRTVGKFSGVESGQWFDPDPTGHVKVVMESASLFTQILELPEGFGEMTVSVGGSVIGVFGAGEMVELGGVSEFEVSWVGEEGAEYGDFPMKLAFDTGVASFRIESLMVVPEPAGVAVVGGMMVVGVMGRKRR